MRVVLLRNLAAIPLEDLAHKLEILRRLDHQLASLALGNLYVLLEDVVVLEAGVQCRNSHSLRDGAEVEHALLPQTCKVVQAVVGASKSCVDHL